MIKIVSRCARLVVALGFVGMAGCSMFQPGAYMAAPGGAAAPSGALPASAGPGPAQEAGGGHDDAAALAGFNGTCLKLAQCYVRLAKDFCSGASDCQFKMTIKGNDQNACKDVLLKVPEVVKPLAMIKPGYGVPPECTR
jgi:hypothetical protein